MQRMEAFIPTLAHIAVQRARWQALATCDKVVEARDGQLIETAANGTVRVIRTIAKPMAVSTSTEPRLRPKLNVSAPLSRSSLVSIDEMAFSACAFNAGVEAVCT